MNKDAQLRPFYLAQILYERTDEDHYLTTAQLMEILENLRPDVDFENETALVTDEILQSFDIVSLVGEIDSVFDVEITPVDLIPENFNSAGAIWDLIRRKLDE